MDTKDYEKLFKQSSELLVVIDTNFIIMSASNAYLEATKTVRENIVGRDIFDVFPDNPDDITANGKSNILASFNRVIKSKTADTIAVIKYDIPKSESQGGGFELKYWRSCHSPILDEFNKVKYIVQHAEDVTENKVLVQQLNDDKKILKIIEESEKRYNMMLMRSPVAFAVLKGKKMVIALANDSIKEIWGKGKLIEGKPLFEVLYELKDSTFPALFDKVYTTGTPFYGDELLAQLKRNDKLEDAYFNFFYQPYLEADETISGVTVIAYEVTSQVILKKALAQQYAAEALALKNIEESNNRYYRMLMHSPFAFSVMKGKDMVVTLANDLMKKFWGKGEQVEGKTLLQVLPELIDQPFPAMIDKVFTTGIPVYANEIRARLQHKDEIKDQYFNVVYQPYHEANGTISGVTTIAYEVTELVFSRKKAEDNEHRYRILIEEASVATALYLGAEIRVQYANDIMLAYWAKDKSVLGKPLIEAMPELAGQPFLPYLAEVYTTGKEYVGVEEKADIIINGQLQIFYFNYTYKALRNKDGEIYGIHHMATDVTSQVLANKKLAESESHFRLLADLMPAKICHADADGNLLYFNKHWLDFTGLNFDELRGAGYHKIMHPEELEEFKKRFHTASETGTNIDMNMRFINKDGQYKWHLNLASPVKDQNGTIKMWVSSTTEIHDQVEQKAALEKAVRERTKQLEEAYKELVFQNEEKGKRAAELTIANKELEAFAYVSSHDLQEPLRKIQILAGRILDKENKNLSPNGKDYFLHMQHAANRMQILIEDLLTFSRLNTTERKFEKTNLNLLIEEVEVVYKELIDEKKAVIDATHLCEVMVIPFQFRQLFHNLIGNSLKFSNPAVPPQIVIRSHIMQSSDIDIGIVLPEKEYCHLTVSDNGIGFKPEYNEKIFELFQRLHDREVYKGTGIGLAIIKKIIDNHKGFIKAEGNPGEGAIFHIYIPNLQR